MLDSSYTNLESPICIMADSYKLQLYNDALERLKLVKSNMDTIIRLADWHSKETGKPFSELLKIGIRSAIKAIKNQRKCDNAGFEGYVRKEVSKAMFEYGLKVKS